MLLKLPNELILEVVDHLTDQSHTYALFQTCRRLRHLLDDTLLRHNIQYSRSSALSWAARKNRLVLAERLIKLGADLNTRFNYFVDFSKTDGRWGCEYDTPLHHAAKPGHNDMIKLLLEGGAHVDEDSESHYGPICHAMAHGHEDAAMLMIDTQYKFWDAEKAEAQAFDLLREACSCRMLKVARFALNFVATTTLKARDDRFLYIVLAPHKKCLDSEDTRNRTYELVKMLIECGACRDHLTCGYGRLYPDPRIQLLFADQNLSEGERTAMNGLQYPPDWLDRLRTLHALRMTKEHGGTKNVERTEQYRLRFSTP